MIEGLKCFFQSANLNFCFILGKNSAILDVPKMVERHLLYLEQYQDSRVGQPYLDRLLELKKEIGTHERTHFKSSRTP